jgi:hypothetical protein
MTVDGFAEALRKPQMHTAKIIQYSNNSGVKGCRVDLFLKGVWYQYSVHRSEAEVYPHEVADAITSAGRRIDREEITRGGRQFDATVWCDGHAYMLVGPAVAGGTGMRDKRSIQREIDECLRDLEAAQRAEKSVCPEPETDLALHRTEEGNPPEVTSECLEAQKRRRSIADRLARLQREYTKLA